MKDNIKITIKNDFQTLRFHLEMINTNINIDNLVYDTFKNLAALRLLL